jgi:hypothetical protein
VWLFLEANGQPLAGEDANTDVPMVEKIAAGEATPTRSSGGWRVAPDESLSKQLAYTGSIPVGASGFLRG